MASQVTRRGPVKPTLNITPLIDVVFLLIVFFMIVNNIVTDETPPLQLPQLDNPQTTEPEGKSRVIVSIVPEQKFKPAGGGRNGPGFSETQVLDRLGFAKAVAVGGKEFNLKQFKELEEFIALSIKERYETHGEPPAILLRADAAIHYNQVLQVMGVVQSAMAKSLGEEAAKTPIQLVAYLED